MESLYYVLSHVCHRRCVHCYDDRFRPYTGAALAAQLDQARADLASIIPNLPARMTYLDRSDVQPDGSLPEKVGRIILAGGELLHPALLEPITYRAIASLSERYRGAGGVRLIVQTTGDLVTLPIVEKLLQLGVWMISVSGLDDYHVGMEGEGKKTQLRNQLEQMFGAVGMHPSGWQASTQPWNQEDGPVYSFFGATEDSWIGKLWPRGRAWQNGLSRATLADNFCNRWSGGLGFLAHRYDGSEVSIEPGGDVFPCCLKTKRPLGNLREEPLVEILESLQGDPVFTAIHQGQPQRMGLSHGWTEAQFLAASRTVTPGGLPYANLCIGCDRFHDEVLGPHLDAMRAKRMLARSVRS